VLADGSGIIIIPRQKENEVVAAAEAIFQKEQEMADGIRKGHSGLEMLEKLGYERMLDKK
jgi:regulator of RNase E activity RraA